MSQAQNFQVFLPIEKVDKAKRTISGYASTSALDSDGEMVSLKAIKAALPDYMRWGNIREMHKLSAVGTAQEANTDDKGLYITAKITDDAAWKKVQEKVYKGFSIGGQKLAKTGNLITEIDLSEISIVDRPANPECSFDVIKAHKAVADAAATLVKIRAPKTIGELAVKALVKMAKAADGIEPADTGSDGDQPKPVKTPKEPVGIDAAHADALKEAKKAKKMAKKKAKLEVKAEKAKKAEDLAKAQVKPVPTPAWLDLGFIDEVLPIPDDTWLNLRKAIKAPPLTKSMRTVGSLSYAFDSVRDAQRSMLREGAAEGNDGQDKEFANSLGDVAKRLADVISRKASHEGGEAVSMTDIDDAYINQFLGKASMMNIANDPLGAAILGLLAKAAAPSAKDLIGKARADMKEAKKTRKAAMDDIEKAHGMIKANFLAKAAKAKGDKEADDEMDNESCMKALNNAHAGMLKAFELDKSAKTFLTKAESMVGQMEESPTTGNEFYEVPAGVNHLGRNKMVTAAPGTKESGGMPPEYDNITPYPGKAHGAGSLAKYAKDGMLPVDLVEMAMENERLLAQNEVLSNLPSGGRRPHMINPGAMAKAFGAVDGERSEDIRSIFKGVNVGAIGGPDEAAHKLEAGKAVGNYLMGGFGKSITSPDFRGLGGGANG